MGVTKWDHKKLVEQVMTQQERNMGGVVALLIRYIKTSINRPNRSGEFPSMPGEPPKKVSARLYGSIVGRVVRTGMTVLGVVGTGIAYGRRLELGFFGRDSRGRVYRQAARPFIRPGLENNKREVKKMLGGG
jgi:hypothetical protein